MKETSIKQDIEEQNHHPKVLRVLLGVTGSVAAIKTPEISVRLVEELLSHNNRNEAQDRQPRYERVEVKILLTEGGNNFWKKAAEYNPTMWERLNNTLENSNTTSPIQIYENDDEWRDWKRVGDPVLHIDLRNWADIFLIAPLSAHTLAKISNGLCDDTLSCVARAWDFGHYRKNESTGAGVASTSQNGVCRQRKNGKPLILAPAMNTAMWEHPLTQQQLLTIQSFGKENVSIVPPQAKVLACGEMGVGALAHVDKLLDAVRDVI